MFVLNYACTNNEGAIKIFVSSKQAWLDPSLAVGIFLLKDKTIEYWMSQCDKMDTFGLRQWNGNFYVEIFGSHVHVNNTRFYTYFGRKKQRKWWPISRKWWPISLRKGIGKILVIGSLKRGTNIGEKFR